MPIIHDLEITADHEDMATRMATMFQEVVREVSTFYMSEKRSDDAISIAHHACSLLLAYCATISVHVIRRNQPDGEGMTRTEATRRFMQLVVNAADEIVAKALTDVEKLEAEERLRFQQPIGEA